MKNIVILKEYDLYLTYSWGDYNHGVCGHTFEVIDYFWHLKDHINCAILLCEDIDERMFRNAIINKYNFTEGEVDLILSRTIFHNRPIMLKGKNILFTDGEAVTGKIKVELLFNKIFYFACGDKSIVDIVTEKVFVLLDQRVYETNKGTHYIKKMNFNRLRVPKSFDNKTLIYATENCRELSQSYIKNLPDNNYLFIGNTTNIDDNRFEVMRPPVKDLFGKFNKYLYTPVAKKWDCSPRFIAECKYMNIEVQYDIDYLDVDLGLKYRMQDIQDNVDSISIDKDQFIINFLKENCEFK
ncbi:MAG: hypothetical protein DRG78_18060 [Epsilonproteobacteria bacterium]|nr:MAG: hypothetical protein DRG78_18060 [Campylobacterota bacterium]